MGGALLQYFVPNTIEAFTLATTLCTILFLTVWILILMCYIRYRKLSPELHEKSNFKMPGGVAMSYVVIVFFLFTIAILSLEADTAKSLMVSPIWFLVLAIGYFGFYKSKIKRNFAQE